MANTNKKTEKVAASKDAVTTPVENVQETKAKQEVDAKAKQEAEEKAKQEADAKAKQEAEEKAKQEADAKAKQEAEEKAKQEAEEKAKQEAEEKAKQEAEEQKPVKGYGFTADAPKRIRYGGEVYSQEEVLNNPELLHELVTGKCAFIKRA